MSRPQDLFGLLGALAACSSNHASPEDAPATTPDSTPGADDPVMDRPAPRAIWASSLGVALSSFPGRATLTRTLDVRASQRRTDLAWTAASDQPWLSVTPSGVSGGTLTVTANPSGLAANQLYLATVAVTAPDPSVHTDQAIRVGLWVGSVAPRSITLVGNGFDPTIVADPVQPIFYTNTGGPDITLYDAYLGVVSRTFTAAVGHAGSMEISSDGTILFVDDVDNRCVVALDTRTGNELRRYPWDARSSSGIAYARPNGHPILMIGAGRAFEVDTGTPRASMIQGALDGKARFAVDPNSEYVYDLGLGFEPSSVSQNAIAYNALGDNPLITGVRGSTITPSTGSFGRGLCASADGARLYVANSAFGFTVLGTRGADRLTELPLLPLPNPNSGGFGDNIACGWNGQIFGASGAVAVYRADGSLATSFELAAASAAMVLSGDNTRIIGAGGAQLSIVSTPNL